MPDEYNYILKLKCWAKPFQRLLNRPKRTTVIVDENIGEQLDIQT